MVFLWVSYGFPTFPCVSCGDTRVYECWVVGFSKRGLVSRVVGVGVWGLGTWGLGFGVTRVVFGLRGLGLIKSLFGFRRAFFPKQRCDTVGFYIGVKRGGARVTVS